MKYRVLVSLWLVPGLVSCVSREVPRSERVVVEIAGDAVTLGDFDRYVARSLRQDEPLLASDVMEALFEQFIEERLLLRAADDAGVRADPKSVARRLEVVEKAQMEKPEENKQASMASILERQLRIEKLVETELFDDLEVTEADVEAHYLANEELFQRPETVTISQILVEDEPLAVELHRRLVADPSIFEALAEEQSIGPEASHGGLLGSFGRGELPPSFEDVVFNLRKGRISDIVETDFGYHIFKLHEKTDARRLSLDEVRDTIRVDLLRAKSEAELARYIEQLKKTYPVTVHREHLNFAFLEWEDKQAGNEERPQ